MEKDTLGLGRIRLSHIEIASRATERLCEELRELGREIESGSADSSDYQRLESWINRTADGHDDKRVQQSFVGVREELKAAKTREEFAAAAIHFASAISVYQAVEKARSTAGLHETIRELTPTRHDVDQLRKVFPIELQYVAAAVASNSTKMICEQIAAIKKMAVGEWLLQKPIQHAYISTGLVHPDPEISMIRDLAVYASYAERRGLEGAEPATAAARTLVASLIEKGL